MATKFWGEEHNGIGKFVRGKSNSEPSPKSSTKLDLKRQLSIQVEYKYFFK
jgi:hypothetical protein